MIDIHNHIVYGVDDGSQSLDQSLRMICEAGRLGIKVIVATPHIRDQTFNHEKLQENFENLSRKASDYGIILKLGCEAYIHPDIVALYKSKKILTLGNSRHILIEFPFNQLPLYVNDLLYRLQLEGTAVVIAHPERYRYFVDDFNLFLRFLDAGCLMQLDAASIIGKHGSHVKSFCKKVLKLKKAHFVASDAHCTEHYRDWYLKSMKKVQQWTGEEYTEALYFKNAARILDNMKEEILLREE
jgi:protein-tyrosine phosphatase